MSRPPNNRSSKVRLAESTVERTARLLSQQFGIRVIWKHGECKTDGTTIYLPTLPDSAPDELLEAVHGFLDHETGHVLFTDFKAMRARNPAPTPTQFHCINVVEDVRIETAICEIFPGSAANLRASHDWIIPKIAKNWANINQFMRACTAYGTLVGYGDDTDFWRDTVDPKTKDLVAKCVAAVGPHDKITSTDLAIDAGLRMYEVLKEFAPEEEEDRKKREKQKKQNASIMESGGTPGQVSPVSKEQLGEVLEQVAAILVVENGSKGSRTNSGYGYQHDLHGDGSYLVYTTAGDTVAKMPDGNLSSNGQRLTRLRDEARELTSVIRTRLVNSLRAQARRRWLGGKDEGKIDSRRLYHAVLGTSENVYKQLTDKMQLDTAVCLAIDHSGSMSGRKLELAGEAAIVLGDVLNTLRVPFAVYGYSTENPLPNQTPRDKGPYARWSRLWIRYYRDFGESWDKGAVRLAGAGHNVQNNTLDAESVKHGIRRLLQRKEKRKILFVLNDGMPYPGYGHLGRCQDHLHDVVASASAAGVEVVAFGIQDDDVKQYYPSHVVIKKLEDLAKEPLQVLDGMLRKGVRVK